MPDIFISPNKDEIDDALPYRPPKTEKQKSLLPQHSHSRLTAFTMYPDGIDFETREKEEEIILLMRQHPIVNVKWILVALFMILAPAILGSFGVFSIFPSGFGVVITLAWYLITMAYIIESFFGWYFNVYFVTNLRVLDVDFYNLIYKRVSDANLDKIQDVTYSMGGVVRTLFNYGDVFIQTAAEVSEFEFLAVPYPDRVAKIMEDLMTKGDK